MRSFAIKHGVEMKPVSFLPNKDYNLTAKQHISTLGQVAAENFRIHWKTEITTYVMEHISDW